ncbi:MAG: hypothetical protein ACXVFV_07445 [Mycobacteriales bacterium]
MLTRSERGVATGVVACLVAGCAVAGSGALDPGRQTATRQAPAASVRAALPSPTATTTPTRSPAPRPVPARPRTAAPRPVAAALPPAPPLTGCPPPKRPPTTSGPSAPPPTPAVPERALPAPVAVHGKATDLAAVRGKGLWATTFGRTPLDVAGLLATARRTGVRSVWVRTGGTRQGYYGDAFLPRLVPAAHAAGIAVVAWDFPTLSDPVADSRRARQALAAGADAFSPDVETPAEGTFLTSRRLALYLSLVRAAAGARPVVATVPWPSEQRGAFPYAAFPAYADVFAPMDYWSCREPGAVVQRSVRVLGRLLPVAPVGQGYDMGPEGGRVGTPSRAETLRFLDASRRAGAIGASLWTVEHAGPQQLDALGRYAWR